jgi:hypothetical protein
MFDGVASAVPRLISPPRAVGNSPHLLAMNDIDRKGLQGKRGKVSSAYFCIVELILTS